MTGTRTTERSEDERARTNALVVFLDQLESRGVWNDQTIRPAIAAGEPYLGVEVERVSSRDWEAGMDIHAWLGPSPPACQTFSVYGPNTGLNQVVGISTNSNRGEVIIESVRRNRPDAQWF